MPTLFLIVIGLYFAVKDKRVGISLVAFAIFSFPLFIFFLSHLILPVWLIRILVPSAVGVPLISALGAEKTLLSLKKKLLVMIIIALFIVINLFTSLNLLHSYQKEDWKKAADFLSRNIKDGDSVLIYRSFFSIPLERYLALEIKINEVHIERESPDEDLSIKLNEEVINLGGDSNTIYLVLASSDVSSNKLVSLMRKTHKLGKRGNLYGIEILVFSRRNQLSSKIK